MPFSTKGRYGLRAMVELAKSFGKSLSVRDICAAQDISKKYLEQIMCSLKKAGLVKSKPGANGGYTLSRHPSEIKIMQVIQALEGNFYPADCLEQGYKCKLINTCVARSVWMKIKEAVDGVLNSITLNNLVNQ